MDLTPNRELNTEVTDNSIKEVDQFVWRIPVCCAENWDTCPHQIGNKKPIKTKNNIGL